MSVCVCVCVCGGLRGRTSSNLSRGLGLPLHLQNDSSCSGSPYPALCSSHLSMLCVQTRLHFHISHVPFVFCMEFNRPLWQRFKLQWHTRRQLSLVDHNSRCVLLLLILRSLVLYKQLGSSVQFAFVLHTMARCKDSYPSPSQATPRGGSWRHVQREGQ